MGQMPHRTIFRHYKVNCVAGVEPALGGEPADVKHQHPLSDTVTRKLKNRSGLSLTTISTHRGWYPLFLDDLFKWMPPVKARFSVSAQRHCVPRGVQHGFPMVVTEHLTGTLFPARQSFTPSSLPFRGCMRVVTHRYSSIAGLRMGTYQQDLIPASLPQIGNDLS